MRRNSTMELICTLAVVSHEGVVIEDLSTGSIMVTSMNKKSTPSKKLIIIVRTSSNTNFRAKFNIIGNIHGIFTQFLNEGRTTVSVKEPSLCIFITKADPDELTAFIIYFKNLLAEDTPVHFSMIALEPPTCLIHLDCQEKYKLTMENIIGMNINLDQFMDLEISDCTLELADYQVPIAGAIRKMKNLTTLKLEGIKLCSSTFLEIESKELNQLHLCQCKTQLQIKSLFKNDLCYKDSLVELCLEENRWSHVPNGVFEFRNLLKLSLSDNRITKLPDKFTNLPKLQELSLCRNRISHLPSSIFKIQNLLKLSLSYNRITQLPENVNDLPSLQELSLTYNRLRHIPSSIFTLQNLLKLSLTCNRITELPNIITKSSKLQVLSLSYNQLSYLPPSIFALQNLLKLSLFCNHINELPDMFANLSQLQVLLLSFNQLSYLPPSIFALQNLSELSLSGNFISELPDTINLPKLKCLLLSNNQLRHLPISIFAIQNLSMLYLSENFITELPDKFTNLPKLEYLSLSYNQLKYLPSSILSLHLKRLDIDHNEFNFEITPPVDSELIVHSLKELSYRTILNHNLIVEEGMLPEKSLKDLVNYSQCVCGCKYVDEGQDLFFFFNLNVSSFCSHSNPSNLKFPIRGKMCNSLKSCYIYHFPKYE